MPLSSNDRPRMYACRRQNPVYKQESKTNTHTTTIAGTAASSQLVLLTQPGGILAYFSTLRAHLSFEYGIGLGVGRF